MNPGPARVLEALRSAGGEPRSGERLSHELGVSRAQVWKHVEALRARGYDVPGAPGGGYRLAAAPDRLYPEEIQAGLATGWFGQTLEWLDTTDSTNRVAAERARDGAPAGTCVLAEGQTAGRGRLGRRFFSPPYLNLYVSAILRPAMALAEAPTVILAAGIAVAETVAEFVPERAAVEIKWPNDVLVDGRKVSGILMESSAEATRVLFLVLGIGVNLNVDPATFPTEFRAHATSLRALRGKPVDRAGFVRALFGKLEAVLDLHAAQGFDALRPRFDARFAMRGRPVRVIEGGGSAREGVAHGIDRDGALLLDTGGAAPERVLAGDVTLAKPEPTA